MREKLKYIELNENQKQLIKIFGIQKKVVLRRKFITSNAYIYKHIKEEISKINHLSFHLRKLEREKQIKSKKKKRNNKH